MYNTAKKKEKKITLREKTKKKKPNITFTLSPLGRIKQNKKPNKRKNYKREK